MKEQNNNREKFIHLGFKSDDYQKIFEKFSRSTCRNFTEYVRKSLLEKPITTKYRNESLDDFMEETIVLRNELITISNNLNLAIKELHTLQHVPEFKDLLIRYELEKTVLFNKVEDIKKHIEKIADQWLQS